MTSIIILFFAVVGLCASTNLPSTFKKCNRKQGDFNDCLKDAVVSVIRQLSASIPEVGLPSLHPLEISALTIKAGNGAVHVDQNYKNLKVRGFDQIQCSNVEADSGFKNFKMECSSPEVTLNFTYEIDGKIMVLPIKGNGPGLITLKDLGVVLTFGLESYDAKGQEKLKVTSHSLKLNPKLITFKLENLFNGNKPLGENINQVLNENWKEMFHEMKPSYEESFAKTFADIFNNLLERVSVSELFEE